MGLKKKIKNLEKRMNINNNKRGYKFNKRVFNIMILLMTIIVLLVWAEYDFEDIRKPHLYLECDKPLTGICVNNFYNYCNPESPEYFGGSNICDQISTDMYAEPYLLDGETIGEKPSFLAENTVLFFVIIILGAFLVNHYLNKRGVINE